MQWKIGLSGDPLVLDAIATADEHGFRHVELLDGKYLLNARLFQGCTTADQARQKAREVLFELNAYAANFLGAKKKISCAEVRSIQPDGSKIAHLMVQESIESSATLAEVVIQDADGTIHRSTPKPPKAPDLHRWMRLMKSDDNVRKVERLLAEQAHDWVNLYRVMEVIENDVGGQNELIRQGYTDKRSRSRFGHSSNHPEAAGDLARHGHNKVQAPSDPMTLHEAGSYVHQIRRRWLQQKLEG